MVAETEVVVHTPPKSPGEELHDNDSDNGTGKSAQDPISTADAVDPQSHHTIAEGHVNMTRYDFQPNRPRVHGERRTRKYIAACMIATNYSHGYACPLEVILFTLG